MKCEFLMIGTELLLGQIVDTNASFMSRVLAENGIDLYQKTTVGDNPERIEGALDAALTRSDVVITSGGLGPTEDDITRDCIARLLGRPLEFREDLYETLVARFRSMRFTMSENNRRQAVAPAGAIAIENPHGTAPGLIVEDARGVIVSMPGVPHELQPMLTDSVIPYLRRKFGLSGVIHSRVLKVCGLGESRVDAAISDLILNSSNPTIGLLASLDAVRIRITAKAGSVEEADALIESIETKVRERLPGLVMGVGESLTIEEVVDALLLQRGWRLGVGGTAHAAMLAQRLSGLESGRFAGALLRAAECGGDPGEAAVQFCEETRQAIGCDCVLAIAGGAEQTAIRFESPDGSQAWSVPVIGATPRSQLRLGVIALEYVRRRLTGTASG